MNERKMVALDSDVYYELQRQRKSPEEKKISDVVRRLLKEART